LNGGGDSGCAGGIAPRVLPPPPPSSSLAVKVGNLDGFDVAPPPLSPDGWLRLDNLAGDFLDGPWPGDRPERGEGDGEDAPRLNVNGALKVRPQLTSQIVTLEGLRS